MSEHDNNKVEVTESLYLKRVVVHGPPIVSRREGSVPFQIERTVYSTSVNRDSVVADYAPFVQASHHGHNLKKDGTLGAERRNLYGLALSDEDRARLAGLKATTRERFQDEIHARWGHGTGAKR